mmetsp:Transcript_81734/g.212604  ORF Transcript_81734/g.212604 Transcript_81734/m.212604 type:complete len:952 (-) Transcript_81734:218-3073(-)
MASMLSFCQGRRPQERQQPQRETYLPLLRPGGGASDEGGSPVLKELPLASRGEESAFVQQWLLSCSDAVALNILVEVASQRPAIVERATAKASSAACRSGDQHPKDFAAEVIEFAPESEASLLDDHAAQDAAAPTPNDGSRQGGTALPSASGPPTAAPAPGESATLQFSCIKYLCAEEETSVTLEVLRINSQGRSQARFRTKDGTARAGQNYEATSGLLVFEPGESRKSIDIKLIDDETYSGVLEFHVLLESEGLVNATLSSHLSVARVQRIDDDVFPNNRFRQQIHEGKVTQLQSIQLLVDYFKLQFANPVIRRGTIKMAICAQLKNVIGIVKLAGNCYLLDRVLIPSSSDKAKDLVLDQHLTLVLLILSGFLPVAFSHVVDYLKQYWRVSSTARMCLSSALANAFMNYNHETRLTIQSGDLVTAITGDVETLVKVGCMNMLVFADQLGKIFLCLAFQLGAHYHYDLQWGYVTLLLMAIFPVVMAATILARLRITTTALSSSLMRHQDLVKHVECMVKHFRLYADFNRRYRCVDTHEENISALSLALRDVSVILENDRYLMKWLTHIVVSFYILFGGLDVVNGSMPPGVFITCLNVFVKVGSHWAAIYATGLQAVYGSPSLERIFRFMNLPSDSRQRMRLSRGQRKSCFDYVDHLESASSSSGACSLDLVPIHLANLSVSLRAVGMQQVRRETTIAFDKLQIDQGHLVALVGRSGEGKSTLLRLLGGAQLPSGEKDLSSQFVIPTHARVLHVTSEPMFVQRGLYENLVFGVPPGHPDGRMERVKEICELVGLPSKVVAGISEEGSQQDYTTMESLSASEKRMVVVARALIANPEILCIHDPTLGVNAGAAEVIMRQLREMVLNRGIALHEGAWASRRPRTCIFSSTRSLCISYAHEVYMVDNIRGVYAVQMHDDAPEQSVDRMKTSSLSHAKAPKDWFLPLATFRSPLRV